MTEDEIKVAIAESVRWTEIHMHRDEDVQMEWLVGRPREHGVKIALPNYPHDLNAIIPLLPDDTTIWINNGIWRVEGHSIICRGNNLATVACEYYLRNKGLWGGCYCGPCSRKIKADKNP